jgi:hypothetical protein
MPTLVLATVCEKVILDANGVPSLISLFSQFNVVVVQGVTLPSNAVAPHDWATFYSWQGTLDEVGLEYEQILEVTGPDGTLSVPPQTIKFTFTSDRLRQHVIGNSQGIPIGKAGIVTVTSRVEHRGQIIVPRSTLSFTIAFVESK